MSTTKTANTWTVDEINAIFAAQGPRPPPCRSLPADAAEMPCSSCECKEDSKLPMDKAPPPDPSRGPVDCLAKILVPSKTMTNLRFIFLREVGGPQCLKRFLDDVRLFGTRSPHWGGTLIIDEPVSLGVPLVIPAFFTLAGTGISGEGGRIEFKGDFGMTPAISFQDFPSGSGTIRDLAILGPGGKNGMRGVKVGPTKFILDDALDPPSGYRLHRVRVSGFGDYGVQGGTNVSNVTIDTCQLIDNGTNLQLVRRCDGWRIRDCIIMGASSWGLDAGKSILGGKKGEKAFSVHGALNDLMITGCRFEGNKSGAIRIHQWSEMPTDPDGKDRTFGIFILGNSFEANANRAVMIEHKGAAARIIGNFFTGNEQLFLPVGETLQNEIQDVGTHIGFNTSAEPAFSVLNTLKAPLLV